MPRKIAQDDSNFLKWRERYSSTRSETFRCHSRRKLAYRVQNRKVSRVGSNKDTPIDIRLICATNMPLYEMVKENRFRQDLLYRINTIEIEIPALRERFEDIPLLANHFLRYYGGKYGKTVSKISEAAMALYAAQTSLAGQHSRTTARH